MRLTLIVCNMYYFHVKLKMVAWRFGKSQRLW